MTTRGPSAALAVVSRFHKKHNGGIQLAVIRQTGCAIRHFSTPGPPAKPPTDDLNRPEKAALVEINGLRRIDPVNPPLSTLPPRLNLPDRGPENVALYYFRIGRAYGKFYLTGIKAVWFNYKASKALRERVKREAGTQSEKSTPRDTMLRLLKRSEFQLLERNSHDIGKLPLFSLLVALFGEWLPLLVPFIPGAVPGTCRIPKQIRGMRAKAEERRRISFRRGISEPSTDQTPQIPGFMEVKAEWPMTDRDYAGLTLDRLRDDQLYHLSSTLNLHNRMWDRIQLPPPSFLLRRGVSKHLAYLSSDDKLLNRDGGVQKLSQDEMMIACEERGMDVLGKREEVLRNELSWWLARQKEDAGKGSAIFTMLFRRPNAWDTVVQRPVKKT